MAADTWPGILLAAYRPDPDVRRGRRCAYLPATARDVRDLEVALAW